MKKLYNKKTLKSLLGVSFATIDRWEHDPEYSHLGFPNRCRIGFKVFWDSEEIDDWIERMLSARKLR